MIALHVVLIVVAMRQFPHFGTCSFYLEIDEKILLIITKLMLMFPRRRRQRDFSTDLFFLLNKTRPIFYTFYYVIS